MISPLLANIYLHYVLDEWFEEEVKPRLRGEAYEIRYADDVLLCFQFKEDAERVLEVLTEEVCEVRSDASPGEDSPGEIRAQCLLSGETDEDQDCHVRLPGLHAPVCH